MGTNTILIACSTQYRVYQNSSSSRLVATVTVIDHCSALASLWKVDSQGNQIPNTKQVLGAGGSVVSLNVDPDESVELFCDGKGSDGCEFQVQVSEAQ
jgi:hypothetical protein